jgi:hypothetical protein
MRTVRTRPTCDDDRGRDLVALRVLLGQRFPGTIDGADQEADPAALARLGRVLDRPRTPKARRRRTKGA